MPRIPRKRLIAAEESDEQSEEEPPRAAQNNQIQTPLDDDSHEESDFETRGDIVREELDIPEEENVTNVHVKKLVRYALACEYARLPIRRDGIKEKVFGKHKVPFKQIFEGAQQQLRQKFGMKMVELPSKEKTTKKARIGNVLRASLETSLIRTGSAAAKATQMVPTKSYILGSTLPPKYRVPAIFPPSHIPDPSTEAAYTALYTMIISLISLFGEDGRLSDAKLDNYLHRMNADVNMPIDKTENTLQKMIKQGYIVKIKENNNGDEITDWMVGPRGKVEVGNRGVQGLVEDVYGDDAPNDLAERIRASLGLKRSREEDVAPVEVAETTQVNHQPRRSGRRANEEDD